VPRGWQIQLLDKSLHRRDGFSCGKESLDAYLKQTARRAQEAGVGGTWVAVDRSEDPDEDGRRPILGYYTVAMASIHLAELPTESRRGLPSQVPAARLARLAVATSAQGEGLGRLLLIDALGRIAQASQQVTAYAVVLGALNDDAKSFYEPYGFLELTNDPLHLFLPMTTVQRLVGET